MNDREIDVSILLSMMKNQRYADAVRRLVLEEEEPRKYAAEIGITIDNLYNIKSLFNNKC